MNTRGSASCGVLRRPAAWFRAGTGPTYRARVMMTVSLHKANSLKLYIIYYILYIIYYILYIIYYISADTKHFVICILYFVFCILYLALSEP